MIRAAAAMNPLRRMPGGRNVGQVSDRRDFIPFDRATRIGLRESEFSAKSYSRNSLNQLIN
jgi:hypothetical protein